MGQASVRTTSDRNIKYSYALCLLSQGELSQEELSQEQRSKKKMRFRAEPFPVYIRT